MLAPPLEYQHLHAVLAPPRGDHRRRRPRLGGAVVSHPGDSARWTWLVAPVLPNSSRSCRYPGQVSAAVAARIRRAIEERGPISFGEYMDLALYGPGGFYDQPSVGRSGHFLTSPHVHPVFAEFLLRAVLDLRELLGRPEPLPLVEVGAGDGTLAASLLRLLGERGGPAVDYAVVERSPGARATLGDLPVRVFERMGDAGHPDAMVVVANELLDNLPFRRVRGTGDGVVEIRIDAARNGFVEVDVPCDAKIAKLAAELGPLAPGQEIIVPTGAMRFVDELATTFRRGYALLIDYGSGRDPSSEVHGYRGHRVLEDVLHDPGSADITAGVDFGAIARRAERGGLRSLGLASQRDGWAGHPSVGGSWPGQPAGRPRGPGETEVAAPGYCRPERPSLAGRGPGRPPTDWRITQTAWTRRRLFTCPEAESFDGVRWVVGTVRGHPLARRGSARSVPGPRQPWRSRDRWPTAGDDHAFVASTGSGACTLGPEERPGASVQGQALRERTARHSKARPPAEGARSKASPRGPGGGIREAARPVDAGEDHGWPSTANRPSGPSEGSPLFVGQPQGDILTISADIVAPSRADRKREPPADRS